MTALVIALLITMRRRCSCKAAMRCGWCRWHGWQE